MSRNDQWMYVSGPIKGYDDGNRAAFQEASRVLSDSGWAVVNPHQIIPGHPSACRIGPTLEGLNHSYECFMRYDLKALVDCDAIFMLRGWEASVGARLERDVARVCGLEIRYQTD